MFAIAGTIELRKTLYVTHPFLTVAGQSAPGAGILITNTASASERDLSALVLISTHDVIWTYTRLRNTYREACSDNRLSECGALFAIEGNPDRQTFNVIASHNSLSWNQDEAFDVWNSAPRRMGDITLAMNLIAEGLATHSTGMIAGGSRSALSLNLQDVDLHHNLIMSNSHRNPLMKGGSGRLVNNIFYNQKFYVSQFGGGGRFDVIGNAYRRGPMSGDVLSEVTAFSSRSSDAVDGSPGLYVSGNRGWSVRNPTADQWAMVRRVRGENGRDAGMAPLTWRRRAPLPASEFPIVINPIEEIVGPEGAIAPLVGASRRVDCKGAWVANRDEVDRRLIREYGLGRGLDRPLRAPAGPARLATTPADQACVDADRDGMADDWELAHFGDLESAAAADADGDGFTNLEAYLYAIPSAR